FGANVLIKPIDGILAEMANDAIRNVDPTRQIDLMANFYFGIASSVLLIVVCTVITDRVVEPRLGKYQGEAPAGESQGVSRDEWRGLLLALLAVAALVGLLVYLTLPEGAPLRNPTTGEVLGSSPFMDSLIFLIMLVFLAAGAAYGVGARTIK